MVAPKANSATGNIYSLPNFCHVNVFGSPFSPLPGRVFYSTSIEKFSFYEAGDQCAKLGARLATTGELYLAWKAGMDVCNAGWLADRSVRYPINIARPQCGGGLLGVRTVYLFPNQTGYPYPDTRYDAICFQGKFFSQVPLFKKFLFYQMWPTWDLVSSDGEEEDVVPGRTTPFPDIIRVTPAPGVQPFLTTPSGSEETKGEVDTLSPLPIPPGMTDTYTEVTPVPGLDLSAFDVTMGPTGKLVTLNCRNTFL